MSLRRLIIVSSFFLSFFANLFAGGNVRGWIILSDNMDRAIRTIKTAKEYNINQLQLSHEIIHDLKAIKEEKVCEQVNELIRLAHLEGIDEGCFGIIAYILWIIIHRVLEQDLMVQ